MATQECFKEMPLSSQYPRKSFGGALLQRSHAKSARPLARNQALHLVLRSEKASGSRSFLKRERLLQNLLLKQGRKHAIKVFRVLIYADHIHLLVRFQQRRGLQNYLRSICGIIARKTLQRERGVGVSTTGQRSPRATLWEERFWDQRPFSRIVSWGPDFRKVDFLIRSKALEPLGFITRVAQESWGGNTIRKHVLERISVALWTSDSIPARLQS